MFTKMQVRLFTRLYTRMTEAYCGMGNWHREPKRGSLFMSISGLGAVSVYQGKVYTHPFADGDNPGGRYDSVPLTGEQHKARIEPLADAVRKILNLGNSG